MDDYPPHFGDGGHHLVRPLVDWSCDPERDAISGEMRQLL
jgi:hypothetical protein